MTSLGGPTGAKAYSLNAFSGDDAAYTGLSWIFDGPSFIFDGRLQPMLFVDAAYGRTRPLEEDDSNVESRFVDAGVGLQLASTGGFKGNLLFAFPMEQEISPEPSEDTAVELDQGTKVLFDLQYTF
jgi:hemolysin activation/secretion protein